MKILAAGLNHVKIYQRTIWNAWSCRCKPASWNNNRELAAIVNTYLPYRKGGADERTGAVMDDGHVVELDDEIDLHHFHPKDVKLLLMDFIEDAKARKVSTIRIIHGKGQSVIKSVVRGILEKSDDISTFHDDNYNWGATIAVLKCEEKK